MDEDDWNEFIENWYGYVDCLLAIWVGDKLAR
jgi:hypothetical protein